MSTIVQESKLSLIKKHGQYLQLQQNEIKPLSAQVSSSDDSVYFKIHFNCRMKPSNMTMSNDVPVI